MPKVALGLGVNVDRERSMRAGLHALKALDEQMRVSCMYESDAVGFEGEPFYNCVVQLQTQLSLQALVTQLKQIEDANGRNREAVDGHAKGLDIDVLIYDELVGEFDGIELPRSDITRYAHVLLPLCEIAADDCLPGTKRSFNELWLAFDRKGQQLSRVAFSL